MDAIDRAIINTLQGGFPICDRPYRRVAETLGIGEEEMISRISVLLAQGVLSRFGPLFHAERMGGALTLAAMKVPETDFERVAQQVNAFPEIAHNYARDHALNMWFVLATEKPDRIAEVIAEIEKTTGLKVYNMPKEAEYYVGLRLNA
ncbi:MAG: Lrp/AsnC family transcriptional regulator [Pseudomonadota bacterium]